MISRREAILETFRLTLEGIDTDVLDPDDYPYSFSKVGRLPRGEAVLTRRLEGAVLPGEESKMRGTAFIDCHLQVIVEFAFTINRGDDPVATEAEKIIAMIQKIGLHDTHLNGLAIDVGVVGVSLDLDTAPEKVIEGAVFFEVSYRHDLQDPKTYMGDPPPTPVAIALT